MHPPPMHPAQAQAAAQYVVCSILISQDMHVGTKFMACATMAGAMLWGGVLAGCVVSRARMMEGPGPPGASGIHHPESRAC